MTGAWTMTDEGEFILNEPYSSILAEAKKRATQAWIDTMMDYLSGETEYDSEFLLEEFSRRAGKANMPPLEIVNSFVIEALEGTLMQNAG